MAQKLVTARDVAVSADVTVQAQDAQLICETLNDALANEDFDPAVYSPEIQHLFQQAWAVGAHKRSRVITIHHLAFALVFNYPDVGKKLAEHLTSDVDAFAVGCILHVLPMGVSTGDAKVPTPAVDTVRWVGNAVAMALQSRHRSELLPEDLVQVVLNGTLPASVSSALRRAATVGNARITTVLGPRSGPSIVAPPTSAGDIVKHMDVVEKGRATTGGTGEPTTMVSILEEFDDRFSTDIAKQNQTLTRIESTIATRLTRVEQLAVPLGDVVKKLETIDRRILALAESLPAPPSGVRVTAAIVAVLTLGLIAGLALTHWYSGSRVTQAASAGVKVATEAAAH